MPGSKSHYVAPLLVGGWDLSDVLNFGLPFLGALVGIGGLLISWRTLPRKCLYYELGHPTSLGLTDKLVLTYNGAPLSAAHTVSVSVHSEGRQGIHSDDFDQGRPVEFDLAPATILELLRATSSPGDYSPLTAKVDGTKLSIGPGALSRDQTVSYLLFVEGEAGLACQAPLAEVEVGSVDSHRRGPLLRLVHHVFDGHSLLTYGLILGFTVYAAYTGYLLYFSPDARGTQLSAYTSVSPAESEGTWQIQFPIEDLPVLPGEMVEDCSSALERAVNAGAGVPVNTMSIRLSAYADGYKSDVAFSDARLVIDETLPRFDGPRLKCPESVSTDWPEGTDVLLVDLDDQTLLFTPRSEPPELASVYDLEIRASADNCYCKWHLELDLDVNGSIQKLVVDASDEIGPVRSADAPLVPFQLVGSVSGNSYSYENGDWRKDG